MRSRTLHLADTAVGAPYYALEQQLFAGTRWRRVDYFEILAVIRGEGRLVSYPPGAPPQVRRVLPGTMIFIRPGEDPLLSGVGVEGISLLYVSFPTADWRTYASLAGLDSVWAAAPPPVIVVFDPADEAVTAPFHRAIERLRDEPSTYDLIRFWVEITPHLFPAERRSGAKGMPSWLVTSLEAMHDEENLRVGVPRMLQLAHVSAPYLAATTRRFLGTTPTALVMDLRLRHAALLLGTTAESVGSIAERCGFSRVNYFSTCFHQVHGVSPRTYRQRAIAGPEPLRSGEQPSRTR